MPVISQPPNSPQPDPTQHLIDYQYVSQFSTDVVGLIVNIADVPTDPDDNLVTVTMFDSEDNFIFTANVTRTDVGTYTYQFLSTQTGTLGYFRLQWNLTLASIPQVTDTYIQIGQANPIYDSLPTEMRQIVDNVWVRFEDVFDSPQGGPHLQVYFQTNMSRGRLAQLLRLALGFLNTMAQPYMTFNTNPTLGEFPYMQWGALLEQALFIETLKHLIRSYTEMPMPDGITVARMDRRDYTDRWRAVMDDEMPWFKQQLDVFKIANMGLGRPRVLVSGGVYGTYGPTRLPGSAAARPMFWSRSY